MHQGIGRGAAADVAGVVAQWQRDAIHRWRQPVERRSLRHWIIVSGAFAEMLAAGGEHGAAAGLVGGHDQSGQRSAEQSAAEIERLQLRVGAGGGEDHLDVGAKAQNGAQFAAHRLDAGVEGGLDAVKDRRLHQRVAGATGGLIAAQRDRGRGAGGELQRVGAGLRTAEIRVHPAGGIERQAGVAAGYQQLIERHKQFAQQASGLAMQALCAEIIGREQRMSADRHCSTSRPARPPSRVCGRCSGRRGRAPGRCGTVGQLWLTSC